MKRFRNTVLCIVILSLILVCAGCSINIDEFENAQIRQNCDAMLTALINDDFQAAYALVSNACTESDFAEPFRQLQKLLGDSKTYTLLLLNIHMDANLTNGESSSQIRSAYELTSETQHLVLDIAMDSQIGITTFLLTPYELTDYYYSGTFQTLRNAGFVQWLFLLLNVIPLGATVLAIVDLVRRKPRKKVLWLLALIFGFMTFGITVSQSMFRVNFNLSWITAYSALIRYGSGTTVARMLFPVGAVAYFASHRPGKEKPPVDETQLPWEAGQPESET